MKVEVMRRGARISFLKVAGRVVEVRVGRKERDGAPGAEDVMRFILRRLEG